jgi:hypothetical protein
LSITYHTTVKITLHQSRIDIAIKDQSRNACPI